MKHLITPLDLSPSELSDLLDLAQDIYSNPEKYGIVSVNDEDVLRFQSHNGGELIDKEKNAIYN